MVDVDAAKEKSRLRGEALARRRSLAGDVRAKANDAISERAFALIALHHPHCVALYWPIGGECATQSLVTSVAAMGAEVGLPAVIDGNGLVFRRYVPGDPLVDGQFGTLEPAHDSSGIQPDLIVVPIVAFDRSGMRLGYGRGYYDSAISTLREAGQQPRLLGIAFSVQEVRAIPPECHDVRLDYVVTEKETLEFRTNRG
jgi:5-formyltetrahydrofolate cyclo-ligase